MSLTAQTKKIFIFLFAVGNSDYSSGDKKTSKFEVQNLGYYFSFLSNN